MGKKSLSLTARTSEARTVDSLRAIFSRTWTLACWLGASSIRRPHVKIQIECYFGSVKKCISLKCTIGGLESLLAMYYVHVRPISANCTTVC
jgi:hypothetical protein